MAACLPNKYSLSIISIISLGTPFNVAYTLQVKTNG